MSFSLRQVNVCLLPKFHVEKPKNIKKIENNKQTKKKKRKEKKRKKKRTCYAVVWIVLVP